MSALPFVLFVIIATVVVSSLLSALVIHDAWAQYRSDANALDRPTRAILQWADAHCPWCAPA